MATEYLERLQSLLRPLARELPADVDLAFKHFFSGAAAYANGRICISLTPVGLAMKLPEAERARMLEQGGEPLRYFPGAPVKKSYAVAPAGLLEDEAELKLWARKSIDHAVTLPLPKPRKGRSR